MILKKKCGKKRSWTEILSQNLAGGIRENHENPLSG
jgi:hypothetical protein